MRRAVLAQPRTFDGEHARLGDDAEGAAVQHLVQLVAHGRLQLACQCGLRHVSAQALCVRTHSVGRQCMPVHAHVCEYVVCVCVSSYVSLGVCVCSVCRKFSHSVST